MNSPRLALPPAVALLLACGGMGGSGDKGTTSTQVPATDGSVTTSGAPRAEPGDCDTPHPTPPPQGCVMARIGCGDTIQGNNRFGEQNFGNEFYVHHFCTPQRLGYDESREAIYQITVPGDKKAIFRLESDCAELDLVAMGWRDPSTCPDMSGPRLVECEMIPKHGADTVTVATVTNAQDFIVAVDGRNGAEGNFTLSVECVDYR